MQQTLRTQYAQKTAPMARRETFTAAMLRSVKPTLSGRVVVWDTEAAGLGLYCTPAGHKAFFLEATFPDGRQSKMKLGTWSDGKIPVMTIAMARAAAKLAIGQIAQGIDPRHQRRQIRSGATFGQLWAMYLERHAKPHKRSWRGDVSQYKCHLSQFSSRPLSTITRSELAMFHVALWTGVGAATANRVLAQVAVMFELAKDWGMAAGDNPARRIRRAPAVERQRVVELGEFPAFFRAACAHPNETPRDAVLMCLFTGQRASSVVAMRWDQINVELGRWLIPMTKNGDPHACPLTGPALEVLQLRRREGPWVFPGRRPGAHLVNISKAWYSIRKAAAQECPSVATLRMHDLRRTMGSWQARTGASLPVVSASLGHRSLETTRRIYAVVDLEPTRLAMEIAAKVMAEMGKGLFVAGGPPHDCQDDGKKNGAHDP